MIITEKVYKIGTQQGEYPAGAGITDSLIAMMKEITSVTRLQQSYTGEVSWVHTPGVPYLGTGNQMADFSDGEFVKISFQPAIEIKEA